MESPYNSSHVFRPAKTLIPYFVEDVYKRQALPISKRENIFQNDLFFNRLASSVLFRDIYSRNDQIIIGKMKMSCKALFIPCIQSARNTTLRSQLLRQK